MFSPTAMSRPVLVSNTAAPKGPPVFAVTLVRRESDDELHAITSRYNGLLLASRSTAGPRRKVKGRSGRDAGFHDGSESFNASRFFVTMASPFFVDMSMPVAQTARHSSRHPILWSD